MDNKYILLYSSKKIDDYLFANSMFKEIRYISPGEKNIEKIYDILKEELESGKEQILFWGIERGWDEAIQKIKNEYPKLKVKVICNTSFSLFYSAHERNNFFRIIEMSKNGYIDDIAFFRKGMYELYKKLGYRCTHILENIILEKKKVKIKKSKDTYIGFYPFSVNWNKNIYNQLSVGAFVKNSVIKYNPVDDRIEEFLNEMKINSCRDSLKIMNEDLHVEGIRKININDISSIVSKNDINLSCDFTEYLHAIYFISMENGVPCILGDNSEIFDEGLVVHSEDNPIEMTKIIENALKNRENILKKYREWKKEYNALSLKALKDFLEK